MCSQASAAMRSCTKGGKFMRKQTLLFMALLCSTVLFAGCKKREAIDLSSLHTTAAVEKETLPPTTEASSEAADETTDDADDSKENSKYSFKTDLKTYTQGNASVQYPLISNLKDTDKEKKVNALLKQNAIGAIDAYPLSDGQSLSVKASIVSANLKRITVVYTGERKGSSAADSTRIFYSNTIDLDTLNNLRLSDFADAYTMAGYIHSGDYKLESVSGADEAAVRSYINSAEKNLDYYYKGLAASDFSRGYKEGEAVKFTADTWPQYFSYEKQGVIYVSVPVSKDLGGYVIVKYSPDNK